MSDPSVPHKANPPSPAYLLGRTTAPLFLQAEWLFRALGGEEAKRIETERLLGTWMAKTYESRMVAVENNRLSRIAEKLTERLRDRRRRFSFKLDRSPQPNALSIPGGFVYVSESLFDLCGEDLDAVAFVLAHEIAHDVLGDAARLRLSRTAIRALLRARRGAHPLLLEATQRLFRQGYARSRELRADRFAARLTHAAGFDPLGGSRLFARMAKLGGDAAKTGWFASHPPATERIDRLRERAEALQ